MNQLGQMKIPTTPASFYRWASRIPSTTLRSHLDFLLNEFDPLFGIQRMAAEIVEIIDETEAVKTYVMQPSIYWQGFVPGQYVAIEVDIDGVRVRRSYSISSSPSMFERRGLISITVKSVAGGMVSNHLPASLDVGSMLHLSEARGEFVLESAEQGKNLAAPLFVAAGSGITPIIAMIEALAESNSLDGVVLIYVARSEQELIFAQHLAALAEANPGFVYVPHFTSSEASRLNKGKLLAYCPDLLERTLYLCGAEGFMSTVKQAAAGLGLEEQSIRSESFGVPKANGLAERLAQYSTEEAGVKQGGAVQVTFAKAQKHMFASGSQTLLEIAEQAGLNPKYGCRSGICHECKCVKSSGRVMNTLTGELVPEDQTSIQACISIPVDDVSIASW